LRKAAEAAQRGRRFTEELLALAGGNEEEPAVLSLHERLQGVLSLLQSRLAGRIKLESHCQPRTTRSARRRACCTRLCSTC
jgi:hypothetical protein